MDPLVGPFQPANKLPVEISHILEAAAWQETGDIAKSCGSGLGG
jgi:hypothetical protein